MSAPLAAAVPKQKCENELKWLLNGFPEAFDRLIIEGKGMLPGFVLKQTYLLNVPHEEIQGLFPNDPIDWNNVVEVRIRQQTQENHQRTQEITKSDGNEKGSKMEEWKRMWITLKSDGTTSRMELETSIDKAMYDNILYKSKIHGQPIVKERYHLSPDHKQHPSLVFEVDWFREPAGLFLAELEFDPEQYNDMDVLRDLAKATFGKQLVKEVTQDKAYKNRNLALNGVPLLSSSS